MKPESIVTACCLVLLGTGLFFAPPGVTDSVRGLTTDVLRPGQQLVRFAKESVFSRFAENADAANSNDLNEIERLTAALELEREQNRSMQIRIAQLLEQQSTDSQISISITKSRRLILPSLIEVAVLGEAISERWRAGKLLDQGAKNGVRENELVLSTRKSRKPLIDQGEDAQISAEDALLLGRCVIGKVEIVGKWSSTIQLVTDSQYRGRAQLIRETSDGLYVFEAQGILKGQGQPRCKLDGIPAEKSVHVRDAVFTADRDGLLPVPLYYGEVVEAVLGNDDREWTVWVKPVELPSHLTTVQLLRTSVNPSRLAVN